MTRFVLLLLSAGGCGSSAGAPGNPDAGLVDGSAVGSSRADAGGANVDGGLGGRIGVDANVPTGVADGSSALSDAGLSTADGPAVDASTAGGLPEAGAPGDSGAAAGGPAPANPKASASVRSLLRFLKGVEGKKVVTGQLGWWHAGWCNNPDPSLWPFIVQQTGHTPALYGGEIWTSDVASEPAKLIQMWNSHTLVTVQWHAPNPAVPGSTAWIGSGNPGLTASQWKDILTPGTSLYAAWLAAIDSTAGALKQLRDAGVTVIWRPFHESHGGWFWWGTTNRPPGALASLYQMMFDRYTNYQGLDNLVWNWNTGGTSLQSMYPGAAYVDIISMDAYGGPLSQDQYQAMLPFGKLVAWGEWGVDASQANVTPTWILANQPKIVYVMQWYGTCTSGSSNGALYKPFFTDPNGVDSPVTLP